MKILEGTVSIKDVARESAVAISTVSNVLNDKKFVSEEIRQRVMDACKRLNYSPNFIAAAMVKKRTNIIGLFFEVGNEHFFDFYSELLKACIIKGNGNKVLVLPIFSPTQEELDFYLKAGSLPIDGAIVLSPSVNDRRLVTFKTNNIPYVIIGKPDLSNNDLFVDIDNNALIFDLAEKLFEYEHKDIIFINGQKDLTISKERDAAFAEISSKHNNFFNIQTYYMDNREEVGFNVADEALSEGRKFSCVVASSDIVAKGVYSALKKHNLSVPNDVSIVALGNSEKMGSFVPSLSCYRQNYMLLGKNACKMLLERIYKDRVSNSTQFVKAEFIEGKSLTRKSD